MRIFVLIALIFSQSYLSVSAATGDIAGSGSTTSSSTNLVLTKPPVPVTTSDTTIQLQWDSLPNPGIKYIVRYGTKSVAESTDVNVQYDDETDPVTATGVTLEGLTPNTTYYMSVVVVQADNKESDLYSPEVSVKTSGEAASTGSGAPTNTPATLALSNVEVTSSKTLVLTFNKTLSQDPVSVNLKKTSDNSSIAVASVKTDLIPTSVVVTLSQDMLADTSYTLAVQAAKDIDGGNIEAGLNGIKIFPTPKVFPGSAVPSLQSAPVSVSPTNNSGSTLSGSNSGSGIIAQELPGTGAKENIMIILAIILSTGAFVYFSSKQKA